MVVATTETTTSGPHTVADLYCELLCAHARTVDCSLFYNLTYDTSSPTITSPLCLILTLVNLHIYVRYHTLHHSCGLLSPSSHSCLVVFRLHVALCLFVRMYFLRAREKRYVS
ncbi:hypothetical protein EXIGLDRAFT_502350 [Exidia glandulosa HHB12029]|uniref:Uncharacterized protein n=1 Tax=Exidia glandulosa HHB12029 TaxID=1314781 RepID=A0A165JET8_EXIGL|nr:hypothetical protein EXIGLDRAFT_502350 [Exidia glandulosa HHB12029]